jgi:hypothetical protein
MQQQQQEAERAIGTNNGENSATPTVSVETFSSDISVNY